MEVRNEELERTRGKVRGLEEASRDKEREMAELQVNLHDLQLSLQEAQAQDREKTRILDSLQVQLAGK